MERRFSRRNSRRPSHAPRRNRSSSTSKKAHKSSDETSLLSTLDESETNISFDEDIMFEDTRAHLQPVKEAAGRAFQAKLEWEQKLRDLIKKRDKMEVWPLTKALIEDTFGLVNPPEEIKPALKLLSRALKIQPDIKLDGSGKKVLDYWSSCKRFFRHRTPSQVDEYLEQCPISEDVVQKIIRFTNLRAMRTVYSSYAVGAFAIVVFRKCSFNATSKAIKEARAQLESVEKDLKEALDEWEELENSLLNKENRTRQILNKTPEVPNPDKNYECK